MRTQLKHQYKVFSVAYFILSLVPYTHAPVNCVGCLH